MKKIIIFFCFLFISFYVYADNFNYKININYPITDYKKLNLLIDEKINYYQKLFFKEIKNITFWNEYTLFINYDGYNYNNIISYVFFIEYFTGGAHPNHDIFTVNYDLMNDKFIDSVYNLDNISKYARSNLIKDKRIVNTDMLFEGTKPTNDNFKNFVFTENGYLFYFKRYQIAPYSSGDISLVIPYKIEKKD